MDHYDIAALVEQAVARQGIPEPRPTRPEAHREAHDLHRDRGTAGIHPAMEFPARQGIPEPRTTRPAAHREAHDLHRDRGTAGFHPDTRVRPEARPEERDYRQAVHRGTHEQRDFRPGARSWSPSIPTDNRDQPDIRRNAHEGRRVARPAFRGQQEVQPEAWSRQDFSPEERDWPPITPGNSRGPLDIRPPEGYPGESGRHEFLQGDRVGPPNNQHGIRGLPGIRLDAPTGRHDARPGEPALEEGEVRGATHALPDDDRYHTRGHGSDRTTTAEGAARSRHGGYAYSPAGYGGRLSSRENTRQQERDLPYAHEPRVARQDGRVPYADYPAFRHDDRGWPTLLPPDDRTPQFGDTATPQRFSPVMHTDMVSVVPDLRPGIYTGQPYTEEDGQPGFRQEESALWTHQTGKREREEDFSYVDTNAHDGQTWGGRNRGFGAPGKDLRIFSHFTLIYDEKELHLMTQKDAHARATAIRGLLRTVDRQKLHHITHDLILDVERVKAALLSGAEDTDGFVAHPGFNQLDKFPSVQTIGLFTAPGKLQGFITHTGWITESYDGLTLRDCLPAHTRPPGWDENTDAAERALLSEAITNLSKALQVVHHWAFQCVELPTADLPDRRFGTISNGLIRYHLEGAVTMWAQDVTTRDCPAVAQYAHYSMNDAETAAHLLGRYLNDVMHRLEGIGYPTVTAHLRPYEAYPHSYFFRKGGPFWRIQATEAGTGTAVCAGPVATTTLRPTPTTSSPTAPTTPPIAATTGHPCFWHICHLGGLTNRRSNDIMVCKTPSCPNPHPAVMPVLTQDMVRSWTTHPPTKARLQALMPHKIPIAWL